MAKGKSPEISRLNSYLEQIRYQLTECYQELVVTKETITPEAIKTNFWELKILEKHLKDLLNTTIPAWIRTLGGEH